MNTGTLLGVLVGGIGGYALSQIDVLRKKSFGPPAVYVGGFTVAGGIIGGVIAQGLGSQLAKNAVASDQPVLPPSNMPPTA